MSIFSTLTRINPNGNKGCKRKPPSALGRELMGEEEKEVRSGEGQKKPPLFLVPPDGLAGVYCGESVLRRCCLSDGRGNLYAATTTLILVTVFCAC